MANFPLYAKRAPMSRFRIQLARGDASTVTNNQEPYEAMEEVSESNTMEPYMLKYEASMEKFTSSQIPHSFLSI